MMPSKAAKKAAGTYIQDDVGCPPPVICWLRRQCRFGSLAHSIETFCTNQPESLEAGLVQVESVTSECVQCRVPCRLYDHESAHPYDSEVRFKLNPVTGETERLV